MKHLFSLLLLMLATAYSAAGTPDVLTATLQYPDGNTEIFKGPDAFAEAYMAAPQGSTIILSPGTFNISYHISHEGAENVTVIGSGFDTDSEKGIFPTVLGGRNNGLIVNSNVRIEGIETGGITFGKYLSSGISNVQLIKCKVSSINMDKGQPFETNNVTIRQCAITGTLTLSAQKDPYTKDKNTVHNNLLVCNSYISGIVTSDINKSSSMLFDHCIFNNGKNNMTLGTVQNSILAINPGKSTIVRNSIFVDGAEFKGDIAQDNITCTSQELFPEDMADLKWSPDKSFKINQPENAWCTDNTETGLYGGLYPYNPIPSIPRITECEIDPSVTTGGKLRIRVKAQAQTED